MLFETKSLIVILIIGLVAGFLAGKIMRGSGFGIIGVRTRWFLYGTSA